MKLAFLYAGQGSQHVGMGRDLYENYPAFRAVLDAAPVDFDLKQLCFEGPEEQLNDTRYTQPCMVAFAAGVTAVLKEEGITPAYTAGLSLGEYSALHCAGVLDAQTAVSLVAFRGKAMAEAVVGRPCGMAAVLNLDRDALKKACEEASDLGVVECTNFNCLGREMGEGDTIPALLERQVQSSVYLEDTIRRLADLGVDTVVEIGPGKALSGFVRKTAKQIKCYPVETAQELQAAVAALKGESDT